MFLWALVCAQSTAMNTLLNNEGALKSINVRFNNIISEVLDAYCAEARYQDMNPDTPAHLLSFSETQNDFFPHFQIWVDFLLRQTAVSMSVGKHRLLACVIGCLYSKKLVPSGLHQDTVGELVNFIRTPSATAEKFNIFWPKSKGRWSGDKGYNAQIGAANAILSKILTA
jgi:hypothetical protein